jgi:4'-phosphopantetheinyl transferase
MDLLWPPTTIPPSLGAGEAHIWTVPIDGVFQQRPEVRELLSDDEKLLADGFRLAEPARRFVATRAALRVLFGHYLHASPEEIRFSVDANKKPHLAGVHSESDLRFNVSHSGELGILAVTIGSDVGVDVEQLREVNQLENIAQRYFHPAEVEAVLATAKDSRSDAFLRCWTAKEAALKAYGTGIVESLNAFNVPLARSFEGWIELSALREAASDSRCWLERIAPCDGYVAAAAFMGEKRRLRCFQFTM